MKKNINYGNNSYCSNSENEIKGFKNEINLQAFSRNQIILSYLNSNLIKCDIEHMNFLIQNRLSPYPSEYSYNKDILDELGKKHFNNSEYSYYLTLAIRDWTTANFFRKKIFSHYKYDYNPNFSNTNKYDLDSITKIFLKSNWYSYTPYNQDFAASFFIKPLPINVTREESYETVKLQISNRINEISAITSAESRLLEAAVRSLPKPTKNDLPQIARGAFKFSLEIEEATNYSNDNSSLYYSLESDQNTFLQIGKIITSRTIWSFANSTEDAKKYSQGVIMTASLHDKCYNWECTYITPFSTNISKIEYACPPGVKWLINNFFIQEEKIFIDLIQLCSEEGYNNV